MHYFPFLSDNMHKESTIQRNRWKTNNRVFFACFFSFILFLFWGWCPTSSHIHSCAHRNVFLNVREKIRLPRMHSSDFMVRIVSVHYATKKKHRSLHERTKMQKKWNEKYLLPMSTNAYPRLFTLSMLCDAGDYERNQCHQLLAFLLTDAAFGEDLIAFVQMYKQKMIYYCSNAC